jgi:hypothetical protein
MQFGRISGIALILLGIVLCGLQAVLVVTPKKDRQASEATTTTNTEHRTTLLPGVVGAGSLLAGIAILATARRRDEPERKYAVK